MKIRLSQYCDFCFGVKRAVHFIEENLRKKEPLYCLGPFIHNPQVIKRFSKRGLRTVSNLREIKAKTLVIRTHGISPDIIKKAKARGMKLLDVTCPNVKRAQKIIRDLSRQNYKVVIVGERPHPEVKSLVGQARGEVFVVNRPEAIERLKLNGARIGVIAQTTQSKDRYLKVLSRLLEKDLSEIKIYNTICEDVAARQNQAKNVARDVQVMLVLGGKMSANSRRLTQICRATGTPTYHIESSSQIKPEWLRAKESVGIASGASTPKWIVNEVISKLRLLRPCGARNDVKILKEEVKD